MSRQVIDLTAVLDGAIQCYPTDPPFRKSWHAEYEADGVYVSKLEMGAHVGTHVDAPLHFFGGGATISQMSPQCFFGAALAIDAPKQPGENIEVSDISGVDIGKNDIVLFRTGWEERSSSPAFFEGEWPGFTPEVIEVLAGKQIKALGGDIASADSPAGISQGAAAHKTAARANLPVFEALINLDKVVGKRFLFIGLPLRLADCEASPVRAIAVLDE